MNTGADNSRAGVLYRAALGPVNPARYLQVLARFDAVGRSLPVWHLPAALFTLNWLVFRRLWSEAALYTVAMAGLLGLCAGLWWLTPGWPVGVRAGLIGSLLLLGLLAPGWMGYALVHRQLQRRVLSAATTATTMDEAVRTLQQQASSWLRLQVLVAGNALLVAALWLAAPAGWPWLPPGAADAELPVPSMAEPAAPPAPPARPAVDLETVAAPAAAAVSAAATAPEPATSTALETANPPAPAPATIAAVSNPATTPAVTAPDPTPMPATMRTTPKVDPPSPSQSLPAAPAAATPAPASTVSGAPARHGVNVGLFAQRDNAVRAFQRLQQAGLPATLERISGPQGERFRVRVGPFADPPVAQDAAQRVRALGLDAVVFGP